MSDDRKAVLYILAMIVAFVGVIWYRVQGIGENAPPMTLDNRLEQIYNTLMVIAILIIWNNLFGRKA